MSIEALERTPNVGILSDIRATRRRLRDYAKVGLTLFSQRIIIYTAAIVLAGAYYSWTMAAAFYVLVGLCEVFDLYVFREILKRRTWGPEDIQRSHLRLVIGTLLSSIAISFFAIAFAQQQSPETGHFMPMFMLVSASIFAAINNHQILFVLALRLTVYVTAIIFIPVYDVVVTSAPLSSEVWLHLFTVVFVLGFLVELARSFLSNYSKSLETLLALEEEHARAKELYAAKTEFLSTVSHELRTPLTSIKAPLEIINAGALGEIPEQMRSPLEIAGRNTKRLADLVEDLLLLQSAESGKLEYKFVTVDLSQVVLDAVERFMPYAESLDVDIKVSPVTGLYPVSCDEKRIGEVIVNLLSNAAKFSDEKGEILIAIDSNGSLVRISVSDNGVGIPDGVGEDIFRPFRQLDSTDARKYNGTGLGLNISKRIVESHGGQLSYKSKLGVGTTFYVDLKSAN